MSFTRLHRHARLACVSASLIVAAACGPDSCCAPPGDVVVTDATVRSCDILVSVAGDEVPQVEFSADVRGQSIPQAPRLGISFAARTDASLQGTAPFSVRFKGAPAALTLISETCFDSAGAVVPGTPVALP